MIDKIMSFYGFTFTKVDFASFCRWKWLEKRQSKITGLFSATLTSTETYKADSCNKLFPGRIITVKETIDSIYYREFVKKEP